MASGGHSAVATQQIRFHGRFMVWKDNMLPVEYRTFAEYPGMFPCSSATRKSQSYFVFLHLPRRNIEQWQEDLNIILQMAINDTDPWVSMALIRHRQSATEVANNKKNNVPNSVPIKSRSFLKKMDTTTPMKGIPSRAPLFNIPFHSQQLKSCLWSLGHCHTSWQHEGGVKFLDIGEQPVGAREAKKRKRQAEMETYTPDYAAGLVAPATPKMPTPVLSTTNALSTQGPTYVPSTARVQATPATAATQQARKNLQQQLQNTLGQPATVVRPTTVTVSVAGQAVTAAANATTVAVAAATTTAPQAAAQQPTTIIVQAAPQALQQQKLVTAQVRLPAGVQVQGQSPMISGQQVQVRLAAQPVAGQPGIQGQAASAQPRKGLSLTRDQMMEAQEMFRVSNKVSRPEKALILGFMAGSRDNPCPQQGNVLNIKLSENEEVVQADGVEKKVLVDTYFQMNYGTGEWKRFKKFRDIPAS
ncbi:hypothetical protein BaRGS_00039046 [Batillaria attramentaria]|uniref:NELF-A N-terminal domain-containing protein n=2 Tax=Batillaria attramentaria TaxID=370345 RepID=A0ABD0J465_9CAEN